MSSRVGYRRLALLVVGEQVEYVAGNGDWRIEAMATVTREPGSTGVWIRLDTISVQGAKADVAVGDEIIAGATEVYK